MIDRDISKAMPTEGDVHVNRPLTNISIAMLQDDTKFVAADVFPIVPVQKQSDMYWSYDNAFWNSDEMQLRAPATQSAGNGYKVDPDNVYTCPIYAFHKDVPDQVRSNADLPLNLDNEATRYVTLKALIKRERLFNSAFMQSGVWTRDFTGVASGTPGPTEVLQWNDVSSTPIEDVWAAKADIAEITGIEPNVLTIGYRVLTALINHPDIVERVKYGGRVQGSPAMIAESDLAQVFKVDKVVVMKAVVNTAKEGHAKNTTFINGKSALLSYAADSPSILAPSAGYIFSWTGYLGAGAQGNRIKRFRMEELAADRVEVEIAFGMKVTAPDLGAFWSGVVA